MAISTYSELQTAVANWLHRDDLTTVIPDFVTLAEDRLNRRLRTRFQESALTATAIDASYLVAIPANTLAVKSLWRVAGGMNYTLQAKTLEDVVYRQQGLEATCYAWEGATWRFDGTGTVAGVLYRTLPPLASNSTNWLLTAHPGLYLYATLAEAANYVQDVENEGKWRAAAEGLIAELNRTAQNDSFSGPLTVRAA